MTRHWKLFLLLHYTVHRNCQPMVQSGISYNEHNLCNTHNLFCNPSKIKSKIFLVPGPCASINSKLQMSLEKSAFKSIQMLIDPQYTLSISGVNLNRGFNGVQLSLQLQHLELLLVQLLGVKNNPSGVALTLWNHQCIYSFVTSPKDPQKTGVFKNV